MKKRECPSCAMQVDRTARECPICKYEFADETNLSYKWVAILLILLFFLYMIL